MMAIPGLAVVKVANCRLLGVERDLKFASSEAGHPESVLISKTARVIKPFNLRNGQILSMADLA
jgi:hypothetical protein